MNIFSGSTKVWKVKRFLGVKKVAKHCHRYMPSIKYSGRRGTIFYVGILPGMLFFWFNSIFNSITLYSKCFFDRICPTHLFPHFPLKSTQANWSPTPFGLKQLIVAGQLFAKIPYSLHAGLVIFSIQSRPHSFIGYTPTLLAHAPRHFWPCIIDCLLHFAGSQIKVSICQK